MDTTALYEMREQVRGILGRLDAALGAEVKGYGGKEEVVKRVVAGEWGLTVQAMLGDSREANVALPRQVSMYLCHQLLGMKPREIGAAHNRERSTPVFAVKAIEARIQTEARFRERMERVRRTIALELARDAVKQAA